MKQFKWKRLIPSALVFVMILITAVQVQAQSGEEVPSKEVQKLEDVVVSEQKAFETTGVEYTPTETVIDFDTYSVVGEKTSVIDVLKRQAIIDFRGETNLDPGVDSVFMRGFESKRFVTAIDSLTLQKTGGRKASNIVDYSLLPTFMIDKVEILPGPHSALYDSKSIGGVINFVCKTPERRDTLKPEGRVSTSYGSYGTQNHEAMVQGAVDSFTYDLAYREYSTDGYLRHNESSTETVYGRLGYVLPHDGFFTFSATHSDVERQIPINNNTAIGDYDSGYPIVEASAFQSWQDPTWDGKSFSYRLNYEQSLPIGRLQAGAYYSKDNRDWNFYFIPGSTDRYNLADTDWWQKGIKVQDEIQWADNHTTTVGLDVARMYDQGVEYKVVGVDKRSGYAQHQWGIVPSLDLTLGLRYEDVTINVGDWSYLAPYVPRADYLEMQWDELIPKSFITWKMDALSPYLRDTSLSLGISKIWRAPDYLGDYNPRGWPTGIWLDPEHGMGYDLVFNRRLWRDISLKLSYAFYIIEDYIAENGTYARNLTRAAGDQIYSDAVINLEEVHRHGVELELAGHLTDALSFNLGYAWQKYHNEGTEPAFETELDQRAEHRVNAGLRYVLFKMTELMLDYYCQTEETTQISEEVRPRVWEFREVSNDTYHLFDFGVKHTFFEQKGFLKNAALNVYVKNIFDEEYYDTSGYLATDRTFGASFSIGF